MGFMSRFMGKTELPIDQWKELKTVEEIENAIALSSEKPIVFFKHSTTCGISNGTKYGLESNWENINADYEFYYIDLLKNRPASNAVADLLNVIHQSPQIVIVKDGKSVYNTSHQAINFAAIKNEIEK